MTALKNFESSAVVQKEVSVSVRGWRRRPTRSILAESSFQLVASSSRLHETVLPAEHLVRRQQLYETKIVYEEHGSDAEGSSRLTSF